MMSHLLDLTCSLPMQRVYAALAELTTVYSRNEMLHTNVDVTNLSICTFSHRRTLHVLLKLSKRGTEGYSYTADATLNSFN